MDGKVMGKLIVDGNRVYTIDEACMRRKNLSPSKIHEIETGGSRRQRDTGSTGYGPDDGRQKRK